MIRRDYILRMIEQFIQALSRLRSLKQERRWEEAAGTLDEEFKRFVGMGAQAVEQLGETELLASVIQGEPPLAVRDKTLLLAGLLILLLAVVAGFALVSFVAFAAVRRPGSNA